jgi:hypothetical protein
MPRRSDARLLLACAALALAAAISTASVSPALAADCNRTIFDGAVVDHRFVGRHSPDTPLPARQAQLAVGNDCGGDTQSTRVEFQVTPGLKLLKVRPNRGIGTAALKLMTLGPGKLTLSGRGVERQAKEVKKAGVYSLIVRPTGRALRSLVRNAKARVRVTAALRPPGAPVSKLSKTILLRRVG